MNGVYRLGMWAVMALFGLGMPVGCGDDIANNYYINPADDTVTGESGTEPSNVNGLGTTAGPGTGDTCNTSAPASFDAFLASANGPLCFAGLACPSEVTGIPYDDCVVEVQFPIQNIEDEERETCQANFNPNAAVACFEDICNFANNCTPITTKSESSVAFPSCASVCGSDTPSPIAHPWGY